MNSLEQKFNDLYNNCLFSYKSELENLNTILSSDEIQDKSNACFPSLQKVNDLNNRLFSVYSYYTDYFSVIETYEDKYNLHDIDFDDWKYIDPKYAIMASKFKTMYENIISMLSMESEVLQ